LFIRDTSDCLYEIHQIVYTRYIRLFIRDTSDCLYEIHQIVFWFFLQIPKPLFQKIPMDFLLKWQIYPSEVVISCSIILSKLEPILPASLCLVHDVLLLLWCLHVVTVVPYHDVSATYSHAYTNLKPRSSNIICDN